MFLLVTDSLVGTTARNEKVSLSQDDFSVFTISGVLGSKVLSALHQFSQKTFVSYCVFFLYLDLKLREKVEKQQWRLWCFSAITCKLVSQMGNNFTELHPTPPPKPYFHPQFRSQSAKLSTHFLFNLTSAPPHPDFFFLLSDDIVYFADTYWY